MVTEMKDRNKNLKLKTFNYSITTEITNEYQIYWFQSIKIILSVGICYAFFMGLVYLEL